jgi:NADH-quinone oxidoreductase subunit L
VALRWNTKLPMVVLGTLAVVAGFINMEPVAHVTDADILFLSSWLDAAPEALAYSTYTALAADFAGYQYADIGPILPGIVALTIALAGAGAAVALYRGPDPEPHTDRLGEVKTVVVSNYYQDEYQVWLAEGLTQRVARAADTFDQSVVDGVVNGASSVSLLGSDRVRRIQTGVVTNYAALITISLVVLLVAFGIYGGWF